MKTMKLMNIMLAVLLSAMLITMTVFADEEIIHDSTLKVPTESGETNVTVPYVYVTGPNDPGVLMKAEDNQSVSATIEGNIDAVYGGADIEASGNSQATLNAGGIRGGFGVLAYIEGGKVTGTVDSITASGDTGLEAAIGKSGSLLFTANSISSDVNAVTVETGIDFSDHIIDNEIIDDPIDPGDGDWDVIPESDESVETGNTGESGPSGKNLPVNDPETLSLSSGKAPVNSTLSGSMTAKADGGSDDIVISSKSIDAGRTAADILLNDARKVSLTADEIMSEGSGVMIELTDKGGDVTLMAPFIDVNEKGILIQAPSGSVTVKNDNYLGGESAAEVYNDGSSVTLDAGFIYSSSGLYVESTSGTTVGNTADIAADNYGIYVRTHRASDEQPFDPDTNAAEQSSTGCYKDDPSVKITVDGDISDDFEFPAEPESDYDLPEAESEEKRIAKDGETEEAEDESESSSTGIIVEADTSGTVEIDVLGEVYMAYGNEIDANKDAEVTVSIQDGITTTYGNRLSADDAMISFSVGESINAGGRALDTLASNDGEIEITITKDINVGDVENDYEEVSAGIFANSMENGSTKINVRGGISAVSGNDDKTAYGIFAENTGGKISISTGNDVIASGSSSVGAAIFNGSDSGYSETETDEETDEIITTVEISGNLSGRLTGLYTDSTDRSKAVVFAEGTVSGGNTGVEISEETTAENLDLTVWEIVLKNGKAVNGGSHAAEIENNIKYLIKYAPNDLEGRVNVFDENGQPLPETHGYRYANMGQTVYFKAVEGDIDAIYNGINRRIPLQREDDGSFSLRIDAGGGVWISSVPSPEPVNPPSHTDFYPFPELDWLYDCELPGTGFPSSHVTAPAARPQGLSYGTTGLTLRIPVLDVIENIVTVPQTDGIYHVEWLDSSVGLLEQSSLPGEGIAVLTGHNHLNTTKAGPFLFIGKMEQGDRIMITDEEYAMKIYSVYGNHKVTANGFAEIADELRENSLVLMTCEDESIDGGYLNRRIILAEPVG